MSETAARTPKAPWWRWQPVTPAETAAYLLVTTVISGLLSVLLDRPFAKSVVWGDFVSGAILGLAINGLTLWIKRHPRHPRG